MYRKKNIVMIVMMAAVLFMAVGYAIFSSTLNISGISDLIGSWDIEISSVTYEATGKAYNISDPMYTNTTVKFNVGVKVPGDKMTFTVVVANNGNIDAKLESIDANVDGTDVIKYSISGIQEKEILRAGQSKTFTVVTEFDINATQIPSNPVKDLTVKLNYVQDDDITEEPSNPNINDETTTITQLILKDNLAQSDANIDFSQASSDTNGKGLYYTNTNTEDNKTTYYFRGAVTNNYVEFAGFFWRIVRINEDGSVRLIYQGKTADATGNAATITKSGVQYSLYDGNNAYMGYMYGDPNSLNYIDAHANINDSNAKVLLDEWYEKNLKENYSNYLADAGFCGDRSKASSAGVWSTDDTALGYGSNTTFYGGNNRFHNHKPQFMCPQTSDLFTTKSSTKGNKALTYPIGTVTIDEAMYAGVTYNPMGDSSNYYLNIGTYYWTMSPSAFQSALGIFQLYIGGAYGHFGNHSSNFRPVINIKGDTIVTKGNGTINNPYSITNWEEHETLVEAILNDNDEQSDTTINVGLPSSYTPYTQNQATSTTSVTFTATTSYAFGSSYTFDESTGTYKLAGNITYSTWQNVSRYSYPYTCKYTNVSSTCGTLYKMSGYTNTTTGTGYAYTSTAGTTTITNGNGLYYTSTNTLDDKTTYYFRGNVTNNYVKFGKWQEKLSEYRGYYSDTSTSYTTYSSLEACNNATSYNYNCTEFTVLANPGDDMYWRIVRINEDGSVRLMYVGTSPVDNGTMQQIHNGIYFESSTPASGAHVGYMYGDIDGTSYNSFHANVNSSDAKEILDSWYNKQLKEYYGVYIVDAGFCGDRSIAPRAGLWYYSDTALGYGTNVTYYGAYNRIDNLQQPSFDCVQKNDLYTTSSNSKGNKALVNPIGMITADELIYAGIGTKYHPNNVNNKFYLSSNINYWTMTPAIQGTSMGSLYHYFSYGIQYMPGNMSSFYVQPVINLKGSVEVTGNGTSTNPYVVNVN